MPDVLIIGAGVAGLSAASYLGRFRRQVLVLDGGASRAEWIPKSHNIPGFPHGIGGKAFVSRLREQAQRHGAEIIRGSAVSVAQEEGAGFTVNTADQAFKSRYVIVATGVEDRLPAVALADEPLLRRVFRVCPICDGFEAINKSIAVVGEGERGAREAEFLRTYSDQVCYLAIGGSGGSGYRQGLESLGVEVIDTDVAALKIQDGALAFTVSHDTDRLFDVAYSALGCSPRAELAQALGAACDENRVLRVNAHQQTTVEGVYAAGDIVRGLNQIVVAAAEAALCATDIHNRLRRLER